MPRSLQNHDERRDKLKDLVVKELKLANDTNDLHIKFGGFEYPDITEQDCPNGRTVYFVPVILEIQHVEFVQGRYGYFQPKEKVL